MAFESRLHLHLVRSTIKEVRLQHTHLYSLAIFADLPEYQPDGPPRIRGYCPDVYAVDVPETCRIIGEAKTPRDLETARSQNQIKAFLEHLSLMPNTYFYLAVPWTYALRASAVLDRISAEAGASNVITTVIRGL